MIEGIFGFFGKNRFLSNFAECIVFHEGWSYTSVEHAYQAAKTNNWEDKARIRNAASAGAAKKLGKEIVIRDDWDDVKVSIMKDLLTQKFSQEPFKSLLIATDTLYIEETNYWNDTFWGVSREKGQNVLGNLLMQIREKIKNENMS